MAKSTLERYTNSDLFPMDRAHCISQTKVYTQETGLMDRCMVRANLVGLMDQDTRGNTNLVKSVELANLSTQVEINIKGIG